jgi:hypothetical protein
MTIPLIQTLDGFEAVRNAIANILVIESANQMALATAATLDPELWRIDVFTERINPLELYRDGENNDAQVVNVWYDNSTTDKAASDNRTMQRADSTFNIDCLAYAVTEETSGGQTCGDQASFERAQRVARLVRRILMHPDYQRLGLPSVVDQRWMMNRRSFQPAVRGLPIEHVAGVQLQFDVKHKENIDLEDLGESEGAFVQIFREPDGKVYAEMDFDWTV